MGELYFNVPSIRSSVRFKERLDFFIQVTTTLIRSTLLPACSSIVWDWLEKKREPAALISSK